MATHQEKYLETLFAEVSARVIDKLREHGEYSSIHEAWAIIKEELDELWDEVRRKKPLRDPFQIRHECIDIAAAALKTAFTFGAEGPCDGGDS